VAHFEAKHCEIQQSVGEMTADPVRGRRVLSDQASDRTWQCVLSLTLTLVSSEHWRAQSDRKAQ